MKTSEPCQQTFWSETELPLTQSAAASPAKTLAMLESALALKVKGLVCGGSTGDLLANYDPASSSWRTSQACLVSGWEPYSETFPRSGMMLSGTVYQLPPLALVTAEIGSGSLLPTPTAGEVNDYNTNWQSLANVDRGGRIMRRIATSLLPTPCASDHRDRGGPSNPAIQRRMNIGKSIELSMYWDGPLNPQFVEEMMGFPVGWTDLDLKPSEMPSSPKSLKSSAEP